MCHIYDHKVCFFLIRLLLISYAHIANYHRSKQQTQEMSPVADMTLLDTTVILHTVCTERQTIHHDLNTLKLAILLFAIDAI